MANLLHYKRKADEDDDGEGGCMSKNKRRTPAKVACCFSPDVKVEEDDTGSSPDVEDEDVMSISDNMAMPPIIPFNLMDASSMVEMSQQPTKQCTHCKRMKSMDNFENTKGRRLNGCATCRGHGRRSTCKKRAAVQASNITLLSDMLSFWMNFVTSPRQRQQYVIPHVVIVTIEHLLC